MTVQKCVGNKSFTIAERGILYHWKWGDTENTCHMVFPGSFIASGN